MSEQIEAPMWDVISQIADLRNLPDFETVAQQKIEEILEASKEATKTSTRPLFALKSAIKTVLQRDWNKILNQNGAHLVDLCVECMSQATGTQEELPLSPAPTKRTPKTKEAAKTVEETTTATTEEEKPKEEEVVEQTATETTETPSSVETVETAEPSTEPAKRGRGVSRRQPAKTPKPEVVKEPAEVKRAPKEASSDDVIQAVQKMFAAFETKVGNAMATILEDNKRTRGMIQDLWQQQRQMILDESYIPPEKLKGWDS